MIYATIQKIESTRFWLTDFMKSSHDSFSNIESEKVLFQDIDLETHIVFGSFYCLKDVQIFIDNGSANSYQITSVYLRNMTHGTFDFFLNKPQTYTHLQNFCFRNVEGKIIDFKSGQKYNFIVISFQSKNLEGKKLELKTHKATFDRSFNDFYYLLFSKATYKKSKILDLSHQLFLKLLTGLGYNDKNYIIYEDPDSGPIMEFEKLIQIGFKRGVYDSKKFLEQFKVSKSSVDKYFRKKYCQTFNQYFTKQKFHLAYSLVSNKKFDLNETTRIIGYKSTSYLSNQLKRIYGRHYLRNIDLA